MIDAVSLMMAGLAGLLLLVLGGVVAWREHPFWVVLVLLLASAVVLLANALRYLRIEEP